jgi:hypothetical protein
MLRQLCQDRERVCRGLFSLLFRERYPVHDEQSDRSGVLQRGYPAPLEKIMPDDVSAALERFQQFLGQYRGDEVIDEASGFNFSDGMLLAGEIELLAGRREPDENPMD